MPLAPGQGKQDSWPGLSRDYGLSSGIGAKRQRFGEWELQPNYPQGYRNSSRFLFYSMLSVLTLPSLEGQDLCVSLGH